MRIDRRAFLSKAALGIAVSSAAGLACKGSQAAGQAAATTPVAAPLPPGTPGSLPASQTASAAAAQTSAAVAPPAVTSNSSWAEIRALFPLSPAYIHMAGMLLASHPAPVQRAIEAHRRELDANPALYLHQVGWMAGKERVRERAAAYLDASAEHIALTDSTTMGLGLVYTGLQLARGDEILTTTHDHYSTHASLQFAAARPGAVMRKIDLYQSGAAATAEQMVRALMSNIRPSTRVVAITWVHSSTGVKLPVAAMGQAISALNARRAARQQILLCVDAVHGLGIEDVRVGELGCDFFIAGTHKWLYGPRGTGIVWGSERGWQAVTPAIPPFETGPYEAWKRNASALAAGVPGALMMTPGGFHSFEHRWALAEAFQLHLDIGKARIQERIHALATQCKQGLSGMRHVRLHTPVAPEVSAGIVCFELAGWEPEAAVSALLKRQVVASASPYAVSYVRLTPCLYNTPEDVDAALAAVRELAGK